MSQAISVAGVSKRFRLPLDRSTTLKYRVVHWRSSSRYRDFDALHDVSFDVGFGEFVGVIGHNGSGKSTLLKILSRIFPPSEGRIVINGTVSPFLELGVGFNPELTARENIFLNGSILGLSRAELRRRMEGIIAFAELEEFADQKLKNFSTGMQVRLAFSVAIQANADILLMDEVIAVGDGRFQEKCLDVFTRHRREGRTVVLVTHDLHSVETFCDRAILLDRGRMIVDGAPNDVVRLYRNRDADQDAAQEGGLHRRLVDGGGEATEIWESGAVRITGVDLIGPEGRPPRGFRSGDMLRVRVDYEVLRPVEHLIVNVGLHRADGQHIAGDDTRREGVELGPQPEGTRGTVSYVVDSLPFLAGSYLVSLALTTPDAARPLVRVEPSYLFHVADPDGRAGIFDVAGRWEVERPPAGERTGAPAAPVQGVTPISRSA